MTETCFVKDLFVYERCMQSTKDSNSSFTNFAELIIMGYKEKTRRQNNLCHYKKYSNGDLIWLKKPYPKKKISVKQIVPSFTPWS
jgi:hypothetical protein